MKKLYLNLFFIAVTLCGVAGCHVSSLYAMSDEIIKCQKDEKPLVKAVRAFCVQEAQNLLSKGVDDDAYNEAIKLILSEEDDKEYEESCELRRQLARMFLVHKERCADATCGLCLASFIGDKEAAEYFLAQGACVNGANSHEIIFDGDFPVCPLNCAVNSGNISLVEFLVSRGADIHADEEIAFEIAFWDLVFDNSALSKLGSDRIAMLKTLLRLGINIHAKSLDSNLTLGERILGYLCDCSHSDMRKCNAQLEDLVAALLSYGVKIDARYCVEGDSISYVPYELDENVKRCTKEKKYPGGVMVTSYSLLYKAVSCGNANLVKILLAHGSDARDGETKVKCNEPPIALFDCCEDGTCFTSCSKMVEHINKTSHLCYYEVIETESPLQIAVKKGYFAIAALLLKHGANLGELSDEHIERLKLFCALQQ